MLESNCRAVGATNAESYEIATHGITCFTQLLLGLLTNAQGFAHLQFKVFRCLHLEALISAGVLGSMENAWVARTEMRKSITKLVPGLQCTTQQECISQMSLQDAVLALLLAAKIHGTNSAVRATAKRCAKNLPRSKRDIILNIAASSDPLKLVHYIADNLE